MNLIFVHIRPIQTPFYMKLKSHFVKRGLNVQTVGTRHTMHISLRQTRFLDMQIFNQILGKQFSTL